MNKLIVMVLAMFAGTLHAKANQNPGEYEDSVRLGVPCMLDISTVSVTRFVSSLYVRELEVSKPGNMLTITMASNYKNYGEFKLVYPTQEAALVALRSYQRQLQGKCER